jgi:2-dehydropantoate 2-reductase
VKIAVLGAGGVGGFFGGLLAQAGCAVSFIARGAHLAALRERGLTIESDVYPAVHVPRVHAVDDPAALGTADLVIIAVKLWDLENAARAIRPLVGPGTAVLSLQNGVVKDDMLRGHFGAAAVLGGVAYVGSCIARPGVIRQTGAMQRVVFGEYDGGRTARVEALHAALGRTRVDVEVAADIRRTLWEKYVFLVGLSGATASMRRTLGPVRSHPRTRAFLHDLMRETVAVGRALGVDLPADYADQRLAFADTLSPEMTSSLHHDLEHGNPLEVEWLSGGVVTLGARAGVATPCNRAVWDVLALHAAGAARTP